jgi:hypothetical protein
MTSMVKFNCYCFYLEAKNYVILLRIILTVIVCG